MAVRPALKQTNVPRRSACASQLSTPHMRKNLSSRSTTLWFEFRNQGLKVGGCTRPGIKLRQRGHVDNAGAAAVAAKAAQHRRPSRVNGGGSRDSVCAHHTTELLQHIKSVNVRHTQYSARAEHRE